MESSHHTSVLTSAAGRQPTKIMGPEEHGAKKSTGPGLVICICDSNEDWGHRLMGPSANLLVFASMRLGDSHPR